MTRKARGCGAGGALLTLAALAGCAGLPAALAPVAPAPALTASPSAPPQASSQAPSEPPTASPTATPGPDPRRPLGPPEAATWTFGTIEEAWRVDGERVSLYVLREPFAGKPAGTSTSYYVRVDGHVHAVHWDDAARFKDLVPGGKVNLYPAENVVCIEDASHPAGSRCWRLMRAYPGKRAMPPLIGI